MKYKGNQNEFNDINIKNFYYYLWKNISYDVNDPKNIQGNINNLTTEQRERICRKAKECYEFANNAVNFEINEKNQEKAIENWRKIFGEKFPKYE